MGTDIGNRIKERRILLGISVDELAEKLGKNRATIYRYESAEIENLPVSILEPLAHALRTTPAYLMGWESNNYVQNNVKNHLIASEGRVAYGETIKRHIIPVLGKVPAGIPVEAVEDVIDFEEITDEMARHGEYFALQIKGDSMLPRILEGDVVIIRKQPDIESGEIGVVMINGEDATVKKVIKHENGLTLISFNQAYYPKFFTAEEVSKMPVQIIGKVVELRGKF